MFTDRIIIVVEINGDENDETLETYCLWVSEFLCSEISCCWELYVMVMWANVRLYLLYFALISVFLHNHLLTAEFLHVKLLQWDRMHDVEPTILSLFCSVTGGSVGACIPTTLHVRSWPIETSLLGR